MNREDFCKLLVEAKKDEGVTTTEMSFRMRMVFPSVVRLEKGKHNFQVNSALKYLSVLGKSMLLKKDDENIKITSYDDIVIFIEKAVYYAGSQKWLADAIGRNPLTLRYIKQKKEVASVDTFLKILDVFGYKISIIKNNGNNEQE